MVNSHEVVKPRDFRAYTRRDLDRMPQLRALDREQVIGIKAVSAVLPFRVNNYVVEDLIRWDDVPRDPMFQLTFPQQGMLERRDFETLRDLVHARASESTIRRAARRVQWKLNPHPAGQMVLNVPRMNGKSVAGMQHKYRQTVLFFPSQGQTCHSYCTYCFRWAQFVGIDELKFASREGEQLAEYVRRHREVTSVLITGGDPLVMKTRILRRYIEPLLTGEFEHLTSIRLGTKAPAYWPYRFLTDPDAEDLLRLFEEVRASGRHLALMAHYSHPRELETAPARAAVRRIQDAGAVVRCQAPLIGHVNDDARVWAEMWRLQVRLGAVPYYMFMERDTGARSYFEVPLARAFEIFHGAWGDVSGLARTARGPVMSATPGKVIVDGFANVGSKKVFVLRFLQARDPGWTGRPFFARYDPRASWLDDLRPALGEKEFFFEEPMRELCGERLGEQDRGAGDNPWLQDLLRA